MRKGSIVKLLVNLITQRKTELFGDSKFWRGKESVFTLPTEDEPK